MTVSFRVEKDSMGQLNVPIDALYGAQTQRAVENFNISGQTMPASFIRALGLIKSAAASVRFWQRQTSSLMRWDTRLRKHRNRYKLRK